jgi:hypothetical protein
VGVWKRAIPLSLLVSVGWASIAGDAFGLEGSAACSACQALPGGTFQGVFGSQATSRTTILTRACAYACDTLSTASSVGPNGANFFRSEYACLFPPGAPSSPHMWCSEFSPMWSRLCPTEYAEWRDDWWDGEYNGERRYATTLFCSATWTGTPYAWDRDDPPGSDWTSDTASRLANGHGIGSREEDQWDNMVGANCAGSVAQILGLPFDTVSYGGFGTRGGPWAEATTILHIPEMQVGTAIQIRWSSGGGHVGLFLGWSSSGTTIIFAEEPSPGYVYRVSPNKPLSDFGIYHGTYDNPPGYFTPYDLNTVACNQASDGDLAFDAAGSRFVWTTERESDAAWFWLERADAPEGPFVRIGGIVTARGGGSTYPFPVGQGATRGFFRIAELDTANILIPHGEMEIR